MATASLRRITLIIVGIVAAGCILSSSLISSKLTPHRHDPRRGLRPKSSADIAAPKGRRRRLSLLSLGYSDPKTVQLRPVNGDYARTDDGRGFANGVDFASTGANNERLPPVRESNFDNLPPSRPQPMGDGAINDGNNNNNNLGNNNNIGNNVGGNNGGNNAVNLRPYNVENAILSVQAFRYTLFFFVYDSATDEFVIVHNVPGCDYGCARIFRIASTVGLALRKNFPDWFTQGGKESKDFLVMISCGDVPRIKRECLLPARGGGSESGGPYACGSGEFAPILQFGSVFVENFFPSMIAMPLPVRPHLPCFDEWQMTDGAKGACQDLRPKVDFTASSIKSGMVFGEELGLLGDSGYWEKLIPQVIWRGTDFQFLHTMFPELRPPSYQMDIEPYVAEFPRTGSPEDDKRWAINTLWKMGDELLLPRWRGVLLTSEAELEAREYAATVGERKPPWANIKFASINVNSIKVPASENEEYIRLSKLGIAAIGEHVNMTEQAKYRYHIDLGGGGGTTWTGTIEKLAMPGVLFHHVTPTKDWFHDLLEPWQHYIPVESDLSDLRKKFEWAEGHPVEAKQIAEQGTAFARWMGSAEGFARLYEDRLVAPLRDVLGAYRPMPPRYGGRSVLDVILESGAERGFTVVGRCSGRRSNSCEQLV